MLENFNMPRFVLPALIIILVEILIFKRSAFYAICATFIGYAGYYVADLLICRQSLDVQNLVNFIFSNFAKKSSKNEPNSSVLCNNVEKIYTFKENSERNHLQQQQQCGICRDFECLLLSNNVDAQNLGSIGKKKRRSSSVAFYVSNVKIDSSLNEALERFLNFTFERYAEHWYANFSDDKTFLIELRHNLRHCAIILLYHVMHVDLTDLILRKLLPPAAEMLNFYVKSREKFTSESSADTPRNLEVFEHKLVEEFVRISPTKIHRASMNKSQELAYLRDLVEFLLQKCVLDRRLKLSHSARIFLKEILTVFVFSPLIDLLCDPRILNLLIELAFEYSLEDAEDSAAEKIRAKVSAVNRAEVLFLDAFATFHGRKNANSFLRVTLNDLLKNQPLLYIFMNFMKRIHGPMNWLQFTLSIFQLKERIHSLKDPPVAKENLDLIRWELWELYRNYFHETSANKIPHFNVGLCEQFKQAAEDSATDFETLKNVTELAYDSISNRLQYEFVADFCLSNEYLEYLCGGQHHGKNAGNDHDADTLESRDYENVDPTNRKRSSEIDEASIEDFRQTVKNVLKSDYAIIDKKITENTLDNEFDIINSDNVSRKSTDSGDSCGSAGSVGSRGSDGDVGAAVKDLSQWSVELSRVEPRRDLQNNKTVYIYVVSVKRRDVGVNLVTPKPSTAGSSSGSVVTLDPAAMDRQDSTDSIHSYGNSPGSVPAPATAYTSISVIPAVTITTGTGTTVAVPNEQEWKLDRKYHEFYVLETKLVEFHGDSILENSPLPAKKIFNMKSRAFVEGMRPVFDKYLKRLLANRRLKHSELLYTFLTSTDEFSLSLLPNPFKVMKNFNSKFTLERGQNLLQFLQNFQDSYSTNTLQYTGTTTKRCSSFAIASNSNLLATSTHSTSSGSGTKDQQQQHSTKLGLHKNTLFKNNFNLSNQKVDELQQKIGEKNRKFFGFSRDLSIFDLFLFVLEHIFKIPQLIYLLLVGFLTPLKPKIDRAVENRTRQELNRVTSPDRLAHVIVLLTDLLYNDDEKELVSRSRDLSESRELSKSRDLLTSRDFSLKSRDEISPLRDVKSSPYDMMTSSSLTASRSRDELSKLSRDRPKSPSFTSTTPVVTSSSYHEFDQSKRDALKSILDFFYNDPSTTISLLLNNKNSQLLLLDRKQFEDGVASILDCLQNPIVNKQLAYCLLDIVVCELFPDLKNV